MIVMLLGPPSSIDDCDAAEVPLEHEAAHAVSLHFKPMGNRQARPIPINKYIYVCMVKRCPN